MTESQEFFLVVVRGAGAGIVSTIFLKTGEKSIMILFDFIQFIAI